VDHLRLMQPTALFLIVVLANIVPCRILRLMKVATIAMEIPNTAAPSANACCMVGFADQVKERNLLVSFA
jgi:hypothetical protein